MTLRPEYSPADVMMTAVSAGNNSVTVLTEKHMGAFEEKIPIEDLKSKDQRSLILAYIDMVSQTSTEHFDLVKLQKITKIDKYAYFYSDTLSE